MTQIPTFNPTQLVDRFSEPTVFWKEHTSQTFDTFGILRLENIRHLTKVRLPPHRKTFQDFFFITKGAFQRAKGVVEYSVKENQLCFIPAHQITYAAPIPKHVTGFACHFNTTILDLNQYTFLRSLPLFEVGGSPIVEIPEKELPKMIYLLERIEEEFYHPQKNQLQLIQSYLLTFFIELSRWVPHNEIQTGDRKAVVVEKFKKLIQQHVPEKITVQDYAALLHITANHLNKCVKSITGKTASDWINEMLILESKVLLAQTNYSIAEIAYSLGKGDQSYFGRFFKKKTGVAPTQYRKMIEKSEL
ncbi:MAG: helix-turn-helix domain-containing protein [Thermonemataceae bacterium]